MFHEQSIVAITPLGYLTVTSPPVSTPTPLDACRMRLATARTDCAVSPKRSSSKSALGAEVRGHPVGYEVGVLVEVPAAAQHEKVINLGRAVGPEDVAGPLDREALG